MYTLKTVRYEPQTANSDANKEKRKVYVETLFHHQSLNIPVIFMDEKNFNIPLSRTQGRSQKAIIEGYIIFFKIGLLQLNAKPNRKGVVSD
ncbi:hypothetical protein A3Q56_04607 [Intoshia linei]|uniref:Tc1-like transposase DDE domain-containing protein n=1 Tax=Intoshia linei TaxID=1819745 RepID=A0A177B091_9BILA|nr:hypothetical protein A3Q56_04607 [Intoshia linei]